MEDVSGPDIHEDEELRFNIIDSDKGPRAINVERIGENAESNYGGVGNQGGSEGASEDESEIEEALEDSQTVELYLSKAVVLTAKASLEDDQDDVFRDQVESWARDLIAAVVRKNPPDFVADIEQSDKQFQLDFPREIVSHIKLFCDNPTDPFDDPNTFVEAAIRDALGLGPEKTESVIVEVPVELVRAAEMSGDVEIDAMVENAIANVIRDR